MGFCCTALIAGWTDCCRLDGAPALQQPESTTSNNSRTGLYEGSMPSRCVVVILLLRVRVVPDPAAYKSPDVRYQNKPAKFSRRVRVDSDRLPARRALSNCTAAARTKRGLGLT